MDPVPPPDGDGPEVGKSGALRHLATAAVALWIGGILVGLLVLPGRHGHPPLIHAPAWLSGFCGACLAILVLLCLGLAFQDARRNPVACAIIGLILVISGAIAAAAAFGLMPR
jgi:hypothetical protein